MIEMELFFVRNRLRERGYELDLTDGAKEFLINVACKDLDYGARPLRRALENRIEDPLAEELLKGTFQGNNRIIVDTVRDDEGKIRRLDFRGETIEQPKPAEEEEAVSAAVGESSEEPEKSQDD